MFAQRWCICARCSAQLADADARTRLTMATRAQLQRICNHRSRSGCRALRWPTFRYAVNRYFHSPLQCGSVCGVFACGMVNLLMIIMCLKIALVSYIDYNPF